MSNARRPRTCQAASNEPLANADAVKAFVDAAIAEQTAKGNKVKDKAEKIVVP